MNHFLAALFAIALAGCAADATSPGPTVGDTNAPVRAPAPASEEEAPVDTFDLILPAPHPEPSCHGCGPGPEPWRELRAPGER